MMLGTQHPYSLHQRKNEELGVGRCKLLHLECISNEVPLYSTGNYIQPLGIECTEDNVGTRMCVCVCVCVCVFIYMCVCMTGSLYCTAKMDAILQPNCTLLRKTFLKSKREKKNRGPHHPFIQALNRDRFLTGHE